MTRKKKKLKVRIKRVKKQIRGLHKKWNKATTMQDISEDKKKSRRYGKKATAIHKKMDRLEAKLGYWEKLQKK